MKFFAVLAAAAAILPTFVVGKSCPAATREKIARSITAAFNEPDYAKSAAEINAFPLTPTCPAIVYVDGAPGVYGGIDATTTKDFANLVRQLFVNVQSKYHSYDNDTTIMDAIVTLGVLHYVQLPVYAHIIVPIQFTPDCLISKLPAYVFVPSNIAGNPVKPPTIPAIPGISTIGGLAPFLAKLAAVGISAGKTAPDGL